MCDIRLSGALGIGRWQGLQDVFASRSARAGSCSLVLVHFGGNGNCCIGGAKDLDLLRCEQNSHHTFLWTLVRNSFQNKV